MYKIMTLAITFAVSGCATTNPEQKLLDAGGVQLMAADIAEVFAGVKESYTAKDVPGLTAETEWAADGRFQASYVIGDNKGTTEGRWFIEGDSRCMKHDAPLPDGSDSECQTLYKTGDSYTSLNPDGSIHGVHKIVR